MNGRPSTRRGHSGLWERTVGCVKGRSQRPPAGPGCARGPRTPRKLASFGRGSGFARPPVEIPGSFAPPESWLPSVAENGFVRSPRMASFRRGRWLRSVAEGGFVPLWGGPGIDIRHGFPRTTAPDRGEAGSTRPRGWLGSAAEGGFVPSCEWLRPVGKSGFARMTNASRPSVTPVGMASLGRDVRPALAIGPRGRGLPGANSIGLVMVEDPGARAAEPIGHRDIPTPFLNKIASRRPALAHSFRPEPRNSRNQVRLQSRFRIRLRDLAGPDGIPRRPTEDGTDATRCPLRHPPVSSGGKEHDARQAPVVGPFRTRYPHQGPIHRS